MVATPHNYQFIVTWTSYTAGL